MVNESASEEEKRLEFFLNHVGIEMVRFESYNELYAQGESNDTIHKKS